MVMSDTEGPGLGSQDLLEQALEQALRRGITSNTVVELLMGKARALSVSDGSFPGPAQLAALSLAEIITALAISVTQAHQIYSALASFRPTPVAEDSLLNMAPDPPATATTKKPAAR